MIYLICLGMQGTGVTPVTVTRYLCESCGELGLTPLSSSIKMIRTPRIIANQRIKLFGVLVRGLTYPVQLPKGCHRCHSHFALRYDWSGPDPTDS
jgi:hypothetical protein